MSARVLVTGGAGFIGSHLAEALLARGDAVAVLDDLSGGRRENVPAAAAFFPVDVRDPGAVRRVFDAFRPTAVAHQAAQASVAVSVREPALDVAVNVLGTVHVLEAAAATGVERVVFASTGGAIYGEVAEGTAATEDHALRPESPYAISKLAAEQLLAVFRRHRGLGCTVLRYANVFGPRQDPHGEAGVVAIFSAAVLAGRPLRVFGREREGDDGCVRDYVFVGDVVAANLAALDGRVGDGPLNVGTGVATTTRALAEALVALGRARGLGPGGGAGATVEQGPPRAGDLGRSVLGVAQARALLGEPTPLDAALGETLAWFAAR